MEKKATSDAEINPEHTSKIPITTKETIVPADGDKNVISNVLS
jgi:hypothetical protein